MKPLSISIASVAILAAASFGAQAQQQPLQQDQAPAARPAPGGGGAGGGAAGNAPETRGGSGAESRDGSRAGGAAKDGTSGGKQQDMPGQARSREDQQGAGGSRDAQGSSDRPNRAESGDRTNQKGAAEKSGDTMNKDAQRTDKPDANKSADQGASGGKPEKRLSAEIKPEQKTVIKQTIVKENIRPQKVDVQIRVGARVPRTVVLHPLPPTIIELYPAYRPYRFVMVDDNTILVIDPVDWEIVDVIEV
jgi:hypothetical protein